MPSDYAQWESIGTSELSPSGEWLAYTIARVDGDGELRIRAVAGDSTRVVLHGSRPAFSSDSRWLAYAVGFSDEERERRQKAGEPARSSVELLDLRSGETTTITDIADFEFSDEGELIALHGYSGESGSGRDLIVRDLARGTTSSFGNIAASEWQEGGVLLAMIVHADNRAGNGIHTWDPRTGVIRTIESDTAEYMGLAWRENAADLAVLRLHGDTSRVRAHSIIAFRDVDSRDPVRRELSPAQHDGFPADHRIVDRRELRWSDDGRTIFFGMVEHAPPDSAAAESNSDEDTADVEVWHTRDVVIVPERKVQARFDASRSRIAAWHLDGNRVVLLADSILTDVTLSDGQYAIGLDFGPWDQERRFGPSYRDLYAIDTESGARVRFAERVQFQYGVSPGGRYMLYVRDGDYWTYDARTERHVNLTGELPTSFVNTENDHTIEEKPPYGTGGWTTGDRTVLLYDRYDIWEVRPDGSGAQKLTNGAADRIRHRRAWLTVEDRIVDWSRPVYVALYGERTKQYGYGVIRPGGGFDTMVLIDSNVSRLTKAADADVYMYRVEAFDDSPDLFVGGPELGAAVQVTNTNAFQDRFAWGHAELIDFRSGAGEDLQAALFYPAGYEPGREYPMIVDVYEITSNTIHNYTSPSEYTAYNPTVFTQNGYFVLRPDIVYRGRDPGISAVDAIVAAVEEASRRVSIDSAGIGLIGHSWGGYQTAFAVTQTDLFSAAVAGAPLTNLISMYLSVFWNTGTPDARIFEIDQARMEVPFWEDLDAYMRNSPLFHIEELNTPLLVAFGDEDGAVDWHQGIELYNAARRAGKEMVLLVYEGENHSLARKPNQLDYHRRVMQWLDHYLKGAPAPGWITKGSVEPQS